MYNMVLLATFMNLKSFVQTLITNIPNIKDGTAAAATAAEKY